MNSIRRFWHRHEYVSIGLLWAAIVGVLFLEALSSPAERVLAGRDVSYLFLPWLRYFAESVQQGSFPLWNPYVFSGVPFVANPQPALFYPPTWLALWLGPERAIGANTALHVWIAAFGAYGWLRALRATRTGALFASIAYGLSGLITVRIMAGHYGVVLEAAWLPMTLWAVTHALNRRSIAWAILAGLPFAMLALAGHTPTFILMAMGIGAFVAFEAIRSAIGFTAESAENAENQNNAALSASSAVKGLFVAPGLFALTAWVGLALAAVQLLPTLTFVQNSARAADASLDFAARFSLPPAHLLTLLVPDLFGEPLHTGYWSEPVFEEYIYYVGVAGLALAVLSIFTRDARARFFAAFGVFGLLVALGPAGGVYSVVHAMLPFFELFRAPARLGIWAVISFAAAAGLCVSYLQSAGVDELRRVLSRRFLPLVASVFLAALIGSRAAYARFEADPSAPERGWMHDLSGDLLTFALILGVSSLLLGLWSWRPKRSALWSSLIAALLIADLGAYHFNLVQMAPSTRGAPYAAAERALGDRLGHSRLIWVYANLFELNLGMDFRQSNVYGYDPLIVSRFQDLMDRVGDLSSPIYDLLNVRYVISQSPLSEEVEQIGESDGFIFYERSRAAPRAWVVHAIVSVADDATVLDRIASADFDPQAVAIVAGDAPCTVEARTGPDSVSIARYEPNRIEAQVDAASDGLLVFSEIDYPGWVASIDGVPAVIHRVDHALRGVCLPGGSHTLVMIYDPPELKTGAVVSLAALGLAGAAGVAIVKQRWREKQ